MPLLESVLTKFKEDNNGFPFEMTEEQWNITIQEMIDHFHLAQEENQAVNIYEEPFMSILAEHRTINIDPHSGNKCISFKDLNNDEQAMREKYYTECARIDKERKMHLKNGLALLGEHLFSLWW